MEKPQIFQQQIQVLDKKSNIQNQQEDTSKKQLIADPKQMRHSKFSSIPGNIHHKMSKTVGDSYSSTINNRNSSNGSSQAGKSYLNFQKSIIPKNQIKTSVHLQSHSQSRNPRPNSWWPLQNSVVRKPSARSKQSNQSGVSPGRQSKGVISGPRVQQKSSQSRNTNSKSRERVQQEAAIHSYFATTRQLNLDLGNTAQNRALQNDSSNSRSPSSRNSLHKGVSALSSASKAMQKSKIKVSRNHPQIYKEAPGGRKRSIESKQIHLSKGLGGASLDSQGSGTPKKSQQQQNLNQLLTKLGQKKNVTTVKSSYYSSKFGKTGPIIYHSTSSGQADSLRKPQISPKRVGISGQISKTMTGLSSNSGLKTVPKSTKNATTKQIIIPGKTNSYSKASKPVLQYQNWASQAEKTKKVVLKKKASLNINQSIASSQKYRHEKPSPQSMTATAWHSSSNPLRSQKAQKVPSQQVTTPQTPNTRTSPRTRPTRASSSYGNTNEIAVGGTSSKRQNSGQVAVYNSNQDEKEPLRVSQISQARLKVVQKLNFKPNQVLDQQVPETQPSPERAIHEVQSSSDQDIPSENEISLDANADRINLFHKYQQYQNNLQNQTPTFIPYLETVQSAKDLKNTQKDAYVWYAAYDEDMNFQQLINRTKQKPSKILPSILMGQEVRFDLDFSKHPYIRQSDPRDREAAYAMVKLYMLHKSQLIEVAKHKNNLIRQDQQVVEIVNDKHIKIQQIRATNSKYESQELLEYDSIQQVSMFSNAPVFVITNSALYSGEVSNLKANRSDNQAWINGGRWIGQSSKAEQSSSGQRILKAIEKRRVLKQRNLSQFQNEHKELIDNMLIGLKQSFTRNYKVPHQALTNYIGQIKGVLPQVVQQSQNQRYESFRPSLGQNRSQPHNSANTNCYCDLNFCSEYFQIEQNSIPVAREGSRGQLVKNMQQFQQVIASRLSQSKMVAQVAEDKRYVGASDLKSPTDGTSVQGNTRSVLNGGSYIPGSDDAHRSVQMDHDASSKGVSRSKQMGVSSAKLAPNQRKIGILNQDQVAQLTRNRRQDQQLAPSYTTGNQIQDPALSDLGESLVDEQMMNTQFKNGPEQSSQQSRLPTSSDQNAQLYVYKRMHDNEIHPNQESMSNTQQEENLAEALGKDEMELSLKSLNSPASPRSPRSPGKFADDLNIYGENPNQEAFFDDNPSSQKNLADYFKDVLVLTSNQKNAANDEQPIKAYQEEIKVNTFLDKMNQDNDQVPMHDGDGGEPEVVFQSVIGQVNHGQRRFDPQDGGLRCQEKLEFGNPNDQHKKTMVKSSQNTQSLTQKNSINLKQSTNNQLRQMNTLPYSPESMQSRLRRSTGGVGSVVTSEMKVSDSSRMKTYGSVLAKPHR